MTKGRWWVRTKVAGMLIGMVVLTIFLTPVPGKASPVYLTWTTRAAMPTVRESFGIATDSGAIYAFGGQNATGQIGTAERYDPSTDTWSELAPMLIPLNGTLGVRGSDGTIYVIGGASNVYDSSTFVQAYDPAANTWSFKTSYPVKTDGAAGVLGPDGKVYVFGGYPGCCFSYLNNAYSYDPATDAWTQLAPMPTPRQSAGAALAANGLIYVAGGNGAGIAPATAMEAYDPATNTWAIEAPMPIAMFAVSLVAAPNGNLYALGNPAGSTYTEVLEYTPTTNSWATLGTVPGGDFNAKAILAGNGNIYAIGGAVVNPDGSVTYVGTNEESSFVSACPSGTSVHIRWHYSASGSSGGWSGTTPFTCPAGVSMGPQAMGGNLKVAPGSTLQAGYDFTIPGDNNSVYVTFTSPEVTFTEVTCANGATPTSSTIAVPMPDESYNSTSGGAWYPSGDQSSSLVYQGSITVPDLCNGGDVDLAHGGIFTASIG